MNGLDVIALGLGTDSPWRIVGQVRDTSVSPHQLKIRIRADRGAKWRINRFLNYAFTASWMIIPF